MIESDSDIGGGEGLDGGASDGAMPSLRELLAFLARSLVEHPDKVEITEIVEPDALVFEIRVAESDLGRIIGRQGRTAKALRTVMAAASAKQKRRVIVDIIE
ncbi:MAG: KH domain-containing protein [Deltaproteobacteria bacterium]|nr:KH domain-containing protein [Deltaproteobacteria bacterium]